MEIKQLLKDYERYVKVIAHRLDTTHEHLDDLIAVGNIGVWKAMESYDESKGAFHNFVIMRIRGGMLNYLSDHSRTIKIPQYQQFGERKQDIFLTSAISMETPLGNDDEAGTIGDLFGSEDEQFNKGHDDAQEVKLIRLRHYLAELKPTYQKIIMMRDLDEKTFAEIGEHFGMSGENIRIKYGKAIDKIRKRFD